MPVVTITDVANRVGVSVATVSRFLSGLNVREEVKIKAAIHDLNYRPNLAARNLKSGRTGTIAIAIPDISNPFFAALARGAESASGDEYLVLLVNTSEDKKREESVLSQLFGRVDGVILAPIQEANEGPSFFRQYGLPIVFVDRVTNDGKHFDAILADNQGGSAMAINHLIEHGHTKIGMISGPTNTTPGKLRAEGYKIALKKAGIETIPEYFVESDFTELGGYKSALELLDLESPPTAIFSGNNLMTVGALKALKKREISIPGEMSLVGFDDFLAADLIDPPLTVINRDAYLQGEQAMKVMLERLRVGNQNSAKHSMVAIELIERGSCAAPRKSSTLSLQKESRKVKQK